MATRIARKAGPRKQADSDIAAEELDVLHSERHITLGGRQVVVREYGHVEWLRLLPAAAPLVEAIAALLEAGREPSYEEALTIVARHIDGLLPLILRAADLDAQTFERLPPDEGELLLMTWWGVNGRFFVGRAINRVAIARVEQRATARSTPPSSHTVTSAPTSSTTPNAS